MCRQKKRPSDSDIALTAMLHDIGYIVFDSLSPVVSDKFHMENDFTVNFSLPVEVVYFFTTHSKKGADLLRYWKLPAQVIEAIEFHHDPNLLVSPLGYILAVSELSQTSDVLKRAECQRLINSLGISQHDYQKMADELEERGIKIIKL